jgi:hypothetical protein
VGYFEGRSKKISSPQAHDDRGELAQRNSLFLSFHVTSSPPSFLSHFFSLTMIVNTDEQPIQAVRNGVTEEVAGIPTAIDHISGCRVVLWSDIQAGFKGTTSVRNGDTLVPFLDDGNLDP